MSGREVEGSKVSEVSDPRAEIHQAISDAIDEYRRQIADIRERHGKKSRSSLQLLR